MLTGSIVRGEQLKCEFVGISSQQLTGSNLMDNSLRQLEEDSTWLLVLKGQLDYERISLALQDAFQELRHSTISPRLIVDLRNLEFPTDADARMVLDIFLEELAAANFTAPIYYALLSEDSILVDYAGQLEAKGLQLPIVRSEIDARTLFNLKIGYDNLKLARDHIYTENVTGIEHLSIHLANETTLPLRRGTSRFPAGGLVKLVAVESNDTLLISPQSGFVLGRRSSEGTQPDIDLSLWGAFQHGVSRRHAKLLINSDGQLCIVELGSANGTFMNGQRLEPFQQYVLHEYDTIWLGRLSVRITYEDLMNS